MYEKLSHCVDLLLEFHSTMEKVLDWCDQNVETAGPDVANKIREVSTRLPPNVVGEVLILLAALHGDQVMADVTSAVQSNLQQMQIDAGLTLGLSEAELGQLTKLQQERKL